MAILLKKLFGSIYCSDNIIRRSSFTERRCPHRRTEDFVTLVKSPTVPVPPLSNKEGTLFSIFKKLSGSIHYRIKILHKNPYTQLFFINSVSIDFVIILYIVYYTNTNKKSIWKNKFMWHFASLDAYCSSLGLDSELTMAFNLTAIVMAFWNVPPMPIRLIWQNSNSSLQ